MVCASRGQFLIPESDPGTAWAGEPMRCWLRNGMLFSVPSMLETSESVRDHVPTPCYGMTCVTGGSG